MRSIFFWGSLSCLQEDDFSLGVFAGEPQLAWIVFVFFYQEVFISVVVTYDLFFLFFYKIQLLSHVIANLIWLTFVVQERGHIGSLEQNVGHRTCSKLLKLIGIAGIIIIKASTRISDLQVSTFLPYLNPLASAFFIFTLKSHKE